MCLNKLIFLFVCVFFLFSPLFSDTRQEELEIIASMKIDLMILQTSIKSYKAKLLDLQSLIKDSQTDLAEQAQLLTDCTAKLMESEKRYSELLTTYNALNEKYHRTTKILKYGSIVAGGIIITEGLLLYLKK